MVAVAEDLLSKVPFGPELDSHRGQAALGAVEDVDPSGFIDPAERLGRRGDRKVCVSSPIDCAPEVRRRQALPKIVELFTNAGDAWTPLVPDLIPYRGQSPARSEKDVNRAEIRLTRSVRRRADGKIVVGVTDLDLYRSSRPRASPQRRLRRLAP